MNDEQKMRMIAQQVFQEMSNQDQFRVSSTPNHVHNGVDSPQLDPKTILNFQTLGSGPGEVVSENTIVTATFSTSIDGPLTVYPVPIVHSGVAGGFNGGKAPEGTIIADEAGGAHHINVMINEAWYYVTLTAL